MIASQEYILGDNLQWKKEENSLSNNLQLLIIQMSVYLTTPGIQINRDVELQLEVIEGKINSRDDFFEQQILYMLRENCDPDIVG